jgi:adenylyltransferase/sulfurtransferase
MQQGDDLRYTRQTILNEIGEDGQEKIGRTRALIIGCGALGSVIANHFTRAGVGKLKIVDRDTVELENLQRQILYDENDIGSPKAISARERLNRINSKIEVEAVVADLNPNSADSIFEDVDIVLDGTDNMETRYLINDICVNKKIPWIYGGAVATYGMTMNIVPEETACLTCAFPQMPKAGSLPTCDTVGVLNMVPSIIASIEATEALKIMINKEYSRDLIVYNVWNHDFQRIKIKRNMDCKTCAHHNYEYLNARRKEVTTVLCGRNSVQITAASGGRISLESLAERLKKIGDVKLGSVHLIFRTQDVQITVFSDGRSIVKGTDDETQAKSIYAKYIGN